MTAPTPTLPFTLPADDALVLNDEAIALLALTPNRREAPLLRHLEHDIDLAAAASELAGASLSVGPRRVYAGALARLDAALGAEPLNDAHLAAYLAMLFATGKSPATLSQVVAAVRLRAKLAGATSPSGPATDRVLAGARRQGRGRGRGQVTGVRWEQADAAAAVAARDGGRGNRGKNDISLTCRSSDTSSSSLQHPGGSASAPPPPRCDTFDTGPECGGRHARIGRKRKP